MANTDRLGEILENVNTKVYDRKARQDITWLSTAIGELRREIKTLARAMGMIVDQTPQIIVARAVRSIQGQAAELAEIHDLLAEALGYHKDAEDDPNSPCPGDYVTGDHTAVTLASEAAKKLKNSRLAEGNLGWSIDCAVIRVEELESELAARQRQCSCAYWPECDQIMPSPECSTHGVESFNKEMLGERAIQELQTLRRILLGKGKSYGGCES